LLKAQVMRGKSFRCLTFGVLSALGFAACGGSSAGAPWDGTPRTGDENGTAAGDAASDAGDPPQPKDFDNLDACTAPKPCLDSLAQLVEGSGHNIGVERLTCLFAALRDRTPGKYQHVTDHTFSNGAIGARHLLLMTADGAVQYARDRYDHILSVASDGGFHKVQGRYGPEPGRRCQLQSASYFDGCIAALKSPEGPDAWACGFGDGTQTVPSALFWFENCTESSPLTCE
jgi:hypothetical protein